MITSSDFQQFPGSILITSIHLLSAFQLWILLLSFRAISQKFSHEPGLGGPLKVTSTSNLLFIQYWKSRLITQAISVDYAEIFSVLIQVALPTDDQLLHVPPSCAIRCPSSIPSVDPRGHHHRHHHHHHHRRRGAWNSDLKQHMC